MTLYEILLITVFSVIFYNEILKALTEKVSEKAILQR